MVKLLVYWTHSFSANIIEIIFKESFGRKGATRIIEETMLHSILLLYNSVRWEKERKWVLKLQLG